MNTMQGEEVYKYNEMKPIRKAVFYEGCKIKVPPRPRHSTFKAVRNPPWDYSPPKRDKRFFALRRSLTKRQDTDANPEGKGGSDECISETPPYTIVNGWQVQVNVPVERLATGKQTSAPKCSDYGESDSCLCPPNYDLVHCAYDKGGN